MSGADKVKNVVVLARAVWGGVDLIKNPSHLGRVFELSDALASTHTDVLDAMAVRFAEEPSGADALARMPRVGAIDLDALARLPEGTLGRAFAEHMRANGLDPASIPTKPARNAGEYVRAHLFETHDIWHVVTGFGADVAGELGLQAFNAAQVPGKLPPILLGGGLLNAAIFAFEDLDARMRAIVRGWLMGKRARSFFGVEWAKMWSRPLAQVRAELGVDLAAVEGVLPAPAGAVSGPSRAAMAA